MDNSRLEQILADGRDRTFWVKPVGLPGSRATASELYNADRLRVDFAVKPAAVEIGDVLLAYRIGDSQLIYIGECVTGMREATPDELTHNPNRGRWPWSIEARNLTPEYGSVWPLHDLRPFRLVEQYNALLPTDPESLNGLMFGSDKLRVSRPFAEFVIGMIAELPRPAAHRA